MTFEVLPLHEDQIEDLWKILDSVARERKYISFLETPPLDNFRAFIRNNLDLGGIHLVAVSNKQVVGWCDVIRSNRPIFRHVGTLGVGVQKEFRGQGIGKALIKAAIDASKKSNVLRLELSVRGQNQRALRIYRNFGFRVEAVKKNASRLNDICENVTQLWVDLSNAHGHYIYKTSDLLLETEEKRELRLILERSFPGYFTDRIYFKQIPSFRFLAKAEGVIIGHVAVTHRAVSINGSPHEIFGIEGLCVTPNHRGKGIAKELISEVHRLACEKNIKNILLFADKDQQSFYNQLGYKALNSSCRWLAIENLESHSIIERDCSDILMIRSNESEIFSDHTIDLLGHMF